MAARRIRGVRLTREERLEVRRLIARGSSFEQAALVARCSTKTVQRVLGSVGGMPARRRGRAKLRLSLAEREEISLGLDARHRAAADAWVPPDTRWCVDSLHARRGPTSDNRSIRPGSRASRGHTMLQQSICRRGVI
jgi:hypothetical protein